MNWGRIYPLLACLLLCTINKHASINLFLKEKKTFFKQQPWAMHVPAIHLVNVDVKLTAHLSVSWILTNTRFFFNSLGLEEMQDALQTPGKKKNRKTVQLHQFVCFHSKFGCRNKISSIEIWFDLRSADCFAGYVGKFIFHHLAWSDLFQGLDRCSLIWIISHSSFASRTEK